MYNAKLSRNRGAVLFKGNTTDGEILANLNETLGGKDDGFFAGCDYIQLKFPGIEVIPGQLYSIYISYDVYVIDDQNKRLEGLEDLVLKSDPIILTFYGGASIDKKLSLIQCSLDENNNIENLSTVDFEFNHEIMVNENFIAEIYEGESLLGSSSDHELQGTKLTVTFPDLPTYTSHKYTIRIPEGVLKMKDDESVKNSKFEIPFTGSSYHEFSYKRITPRASEPSLIEEILISYNFPEGCGFVNMEDAGITGYPMKVYKGEEPSEENYLITVNGETTDGGALLFKPKYDFDAESKYTFVIEEGVVKPWIIGGTRGKTLPDYKCKPVTVTYTTPAIADIPKVVITPQGSELPGFGSLEEEIRIPFEPYSFAETDYRVTSSDKIFYEDGSRGYHPLYEIGTEEDSLIGYYFFYARTTSENGCYLELSTIDEENLPILMEGKEYEFRFPAGAYVAEQSLLKKYSGSEAFVYRFKGTTSPINDFGLTANVDERLHSHADVFSFVTESEVKAAENAKMILKDGEENVAEAPVYVSREANGHRVYADFGGKKLESGKSYDVVLPEGSVFATNGIVNNPEIKSAITAMPEAPEVPEFISVALNIDEYASATYRMVKGQESVLGLKAGNDWKLDKLTLNGEDVTAEVAENGLYTLPALNEDAKLDATYAYAHAIDYDYETGVGNIEDIPYSLSKDGSHVIISGLNGGEQIAIYTIGGMKIADLPTVPAEMHEASIALPEGQVYIVMINTTTFKWKH
ncbi:MAG: hypothetical protein K2K81_07660 [Muribaculaceae bacterium]|nr:hypothetical protein [Muribaculaceae bacterium]